MFRLHYVSLNMTWGLRALAQCTARALLPRMAHVILNGAQAELKDGRAQHERANTPCPPKADAPPKGGASS